MSNKVASVNLTFFTCCCYIWLMLLPFAPLIALFLLIVGNINTSTFSFHVRIKFGLRFTTEAIRLGSMSLNMSQIISFSILLCQLCVFLIILKNSIKKAFLVTWSKNGDLHFFFYLNDFSYALQFYYQRLLLMLFLFNELIFWYFENSWKKLVQN